MVVPVCGFVATMTAQNKHGESLYNSCALMLREMTTNGYRGMYSSRYRSRFCSDSVTVTPNPGINSREASPTSAGRAASARFAAYCASITAGAGLLWDGLLLSGVMGACDDGDIALLF